MPTATIDDLSKAVAPLLKSDEEKARAVVSAVFAACSEAIQAGKGVEFRDFARIGFAGGSFATEAEIQSQVAAKLGVPPDNAGALLNASLQGIQRLVLMEKDVVADNFGTFRVRKEKAKIAKDPKHGHKVLSGAKRFFAFDPGSVFAGRKAEVMVAEGWAKQVQTQRTATVLAVVPEKDFFVDCIIYYFNKAGWKTHIATTVAEAEKQLEEGGVYLTILDSGVKEWQRLAEKVKGGRMTAHIPLVITFPPSVNLDSPKQFMICGDAHVVQPFEVKKLFTICDDELVRSSEEEAIFEQQVLFQFPTEDGSVEKANEFGHELFEASGLSEEAQVAIAAAFREGIGNAAQHGNKYRRDKKIEVLYLLDKEKITCMVKDQGQGFDHEKYVKKGKAGDALGAARERHKEGKLGGLGIMLMLKCCDRIEYNDVGNAITLTKFLKSNSPE
ncbi:MAG: ATP-binding protein [Candidatus Brocadiae bacterium]|nr:ATP-binding protein [Candidatus Brocadiia bacterium]